ncbi:MAG: hypothetical protein K6T29_10470, partial [Peptococcaceae bacterium]|nr:hypothetical protein [Peptococcaceae bacterium]
MKGLGVFHVKHQPDRTPNLLRSGTRKSREQDLAKGNGKYRPRWLYGCCLDNASRLNDPRHRKTNRRRLRNR